MARAIDKGTLIGVLDIHGREIANGDRIRVQYVNHKETPKEEIVKEKSTIEVVTDEDETLPLVEEECSKCGHGKAYYWLVQTRAGDEGDTKFYKCEKCKHTWRE